MVSTLQTYKLLLIELVEKVCLLDSIYKDYATCEDLISILEPYFETKELPHVAPEDLFAEYEGNLKEMLVNAEPILKSDYGYVMGFPSLVQAAHRLHESYFSAKHLMKLTRDNFTSFVLTHFKSNLNEFVLNPGPKTASETGFNELVHELSCVKKDGDESINRERKARRKYYLHTLKEANPGDEIPTLLELETGFSIWYESIINDCLVVGNFGPV
ncbi:MAG: hypothetical protein Q4E47_01480 [Candidatus Saccharibacteria bacterium]|nr:hypothetical protein [Candidatus Saccharibacteria bacterium]